MLHKITKTMVLSLGDTHVFKTSYLKIHLFHICLDYVLREFIGLLKNGLTIKKKGKNRRYPAETITEADYKDEVSLVTHAPTQAESILHSREQAAGSISLYLNSNKTECMF